MIRPFNLGVQVMFFSYITVVGFMYFGPVGLIPLGWWVWGHELERRHG